MQKIMKVLTFICFVIVLCSVLTQASVVFERKESKKYYSEFWDEPQEYDVWFMGTSHMYHAVQPLELWKQYGIRSYNLASSSSYMAQIYWTLMCALEYHQPEVIVVDTYKVHLNEKHQDDNRGAIHTGMDRIPLSITKIKGICDIFDTWEDRFEYICKFSIYHSRWEELTEDDFDSQTLAAKGARYKDKVKDNSDFQIIAKEDMSDTNTTGFFYLRKIIEECQRRGIKLILTELPFCSTEENQKGMNAVPNMAEEYGVECLNMAYEEGVVDYGIDYADKGHANLFGAKKLTKYMGDYLSEHCNLTDYRESPEVSEKWNADYERYLQFKVNKMRKTEKIKSYVQWISDDSYTCYMYQKKEPEDLLAKEIEQLDNITYISLEEAEERMGEKIKGEYAFFVEDSSGEVLDKAVFKKGKRQ